MARAHTDERSELDWVAMLCLAPSLLYVFAMFIYPFMYGVYVSLQPMKGEAWSIKNYVAFFSDPYQLATIKTTFLLALPTTVVVVWSRCSSPTACGAASGWSAPSRRFWCCRSRSV